MVEPVVVHPSPPPPDLVQTLDLAGIAWQAIASIEEINTAEPQDGWTGAVVSLDADPALAWQIIRALRKRDNPVAPLLILIGGAHLADLSMRDELFDDFCLSPFHPRELEARLRHLLWRSSTAPSGDVIEYGQLALNTETYQATIAGRSLDLTYMEYELLKFLAQQPGKVFTREMLLSRVWGYEYYGGARTVDVHIRRLRAKLGEEHAQLIDTVRSVGYRFGQSRWTT
jgi:DNA-binding response OmpR family regulator